MDLNAPLGMTPPRHSRRRPVLLLGGVLLAALACGVAYVLATADPRGGRPFIEARLPAPLPPAPPLVAHPQGLDMTPTATAVAPALPVRGAADIASIGSNGSAGTLEGGVMVYRGTAGGPAASSTPSGPVIINVTRALDDPLGKSKAPALPGGKAASAAGAAPPAAKIAIFVSGMGLDATATRTAIDTMPAAVTLAFLPYGKTLTSDVEAARGKGHEILLQLPMRNTGGSTPGPHTLRVDASPDATKADLTWLMSRFSGYDGVTNLLGAPVTSDTGAMTLVLKAVAARHLFYLDDGTSPKSVAGGLAPDLNAAAVKADVVLDATADPAIVRANLDRLVAVAKKKGAAIGMASGLPEHLGTIARFASAIDGKTVTLVPVNVIAHADEIARTATTR